MPWKPIENTDDVEFDGGILTTVEFNHHSYGTVEAEYLIFDDVIAHRIRVPVRYVEVWEDEKDEKRDSGAGDPVPGGGGLPDDTAEPSQGTGADE